MGQTFQDFELIVVDDGSTDDSLEILQSYAGKYPTMIRVLTHPERQNRGTSVTDNRALKEARGKYWCSHDSDDVSYPDRFERQVALMESRPEIGWIYGVADFIDKAGKPLNIQYGHDLSACPDLVENIILESSIAPQMVRMECMTAVGPFEPGLVRGEWEFWIRMAARFPAAFLPGPVGAHRRHDYNTSIIFRENETPERIRQDYQNSIEVFSTLSRKADAAEGRLFRPRTRALFDLMLASLHILMGDDASASRMAAAVFRSDPSLRADWVQLAGYLGGFKSVRLAAMMVRELGFPPPWLASATFMSALLRIVAYRAWHRFLPPRAPIQRSATKSVVWNGKV